MTTLISAKRTYAQKQSLDNHQRPERPQPTLYSTPGFQILKDGTVLITVEPSVSSDASTPASPSLGWLLLRQNPDERERIFQAIDGQAGIDVSALREALRLNSTDMEALRKAFDKNNGLRRLSAAQPPCESSPQVVVQALQQAVRSFRPGLSMPDVLTLAKFAAREIKRRSPVEEIPVEYQARHLYESIAADAYFKEKDRTLESDELLQGGPGWVEMQVEDQLANANDALAPLLIAPARWLDKMLSRATSKVPPLPQERDIRNVYALLIGQCLSLGEAGPQRLHHVLQHHVRVAVDKLRVENRPEGSQTMQQTQSSERVVEQADSSKKRKAGQLDAPPAMGLSVEQSRELARAEELHAIVESQQIVPQQILLNAFKDHVSPYLISRWAADLAQDATIKTDAQFIERVFHNRLKRTQFDVLLTISSQLKLSHLAWASPGDRRTAHTPASPGSTEFCALHQRHSTQRFKLEERPRRSCAGQARVVAPFIDLT